MGINKELEEKMLQATQDFQKRISESFKPLQEQISKIFENISIVLKRVPDSIKILAENGWFVPLSIETSAIPFYAEEIKKHNSDFVNTELIKLFDSQIDYIEENLMERFPHRKKPIVAALKAHKNSEYYLSIPVFFAQIEGICYELTGFRFFKISKERPLTEQWVSNFITGTFTETFLEPLKHKGLVRQIQIPGHPIGLNRHDVLHGDSLDYGDDKVNSYKSLSLLFYMSETVFDATKELSAPLQINQ